MPVSNHSRRVETIVTSERSTWLACAGLLSRRHRIDPRVEHVCKSCSVYHKRRRSTVSGHTLRTAVKVSLQPVGRDSEGKCERCWNAVAENTNYYVAADKSKTRYVITIAEDCSRLATSHDGALSFARSWIDVQQYIKLFSKIFIV